MTGKTRDSYDHGAYSNGVGERRRYNRRTSDLPLASLQSEERMKEMEVKHADELGNKLMKIFELYAEETITVERISRVVGPVLRMIEAGEFD